MPYVLTLFVLAPHIDVEITDTFYADIKEANNKLPELIGALEKFDALMENFVELETTVLSLGAREVAFQPTTTDIVVSRNLISRRILNFLSSGRLYQDGLRFHVFKLLGRKDPAASDILARLESDSPDQPMAYRVVNKLRNYVQHRELPISGISLHHAKDLDENNDMVGLATWVEPRIDAVEVSADVRGAAPDLIAELKRLGTSVNPLPLLRKYVEHLGSVHLECRSLLEKHETRWEGTLAQAESQYAAACPGTKLLGLGAGFRHDDGTIPDRENISQHWSEYRKYLKVKHITTVNYAMRYVKWSV